MHFANCTTLGAVLFTTSIENLRLCSSAKAGVVLEILSLKVLKKVLLKIVLKILSKN